MVINVRALEPRGRECSSRWGSRWLCVRVREGTGRVGKHSGDTRGHSLESWHAPVAQEGAWVSASFLNTTSSSSSACATSRLRVEVLKSGSKLHFTFTRTTLFDTHVLYLVAADFPVLHCDVHITLHQKASLVCTTELEGSSRGSLFCPLPRSTWTGDTHRAHEVPGRWHLPSPPFPCGTFQVLY